MTRRFAGPRTIVTTDPELDDLNSLLRLLLYSNEIDIVGLVYSSSQFHYAGDPAAGTAPPAAASGEPPRVSDVKQAQRLLEQHSPGKAAEVALRATRQQPGNAEAWLTLGAAYEAIGRKAAAREAYRSCAKQAFGPGVVECRALSGD